jgi:predicted CoA-binding protein
VTEYSDALIGRILREARSFAMVGASANTTRPSYFVLKYLTDKNYRVTPVNPGLAGGEILGRKVYGALGEIPHEIDVVDVFRAADAAPQIARDAVAIGAKVLWLQLGVVSEEARAIAEESGLTVVMNRCPKFEYGRLSGEIGWAGFNTRQLSSRRPALAPGFQHRLISQGRDP